MAELEELVGADGKTNKSGAVLTVALRGCAPQQPPHDGYGAAYSQDGVRYPSHGGWVLAARRPLRRSMRIL